MNRVKQLLGVKVKLPLVGPVPVVALIAVIIVLIVVIIAVVGDDNVDSDPPTDPCNVTSDRPNDCDCTGDGQCASSNCIYRKCAAGRKIDQIQITFLELEANVTHNNPNVRLTIILKDPLEGDIQRGGRITGHINHYTSGDFESSYAHRVKLDATFYESEKVDNQQIRVRITDERLWNQLVYLRNYELSGVDMGYTVFGPTLNLNIF